MGEIEIPNPALYCYIYLGIIYFLCFISETYFDFIVGNLGKFQNQNSFIMGYIIRYGFYLLVYVEIARGSIFSRFIPYVKAFFIQDEKTQIILYEKIKNISQ